MDPFAGTGTTCRLALGLGRRVLGIELNPDYAELASREVESNRLAVA
jgi:DNA modification methylase